MDYNEGFGFMDEKTKMEMARLGIGQPPVDIERLKAEEAQRIAMQEAIVNDENARRQMTQQAVQNDSLGHDNTMSESDRHRKVQEYLDSVMPRRSQPEQQIPKVDKPENDVFSFWNDPKPRDERTPDVDTSRSSNEDDIYGYRKGIVEAAVSLGRDPKRIEDVIANMTPQDFVVAASIKMEYEENLRKGLITSDGLPVRQAPRQLEFNSLKSRPSPSIASITRAPETTYSKLDTSSVLRDKIRSQFYQN